MDGKNEIQRLWHFEPIEELIAKFKECIELNKE